MQKYFYLFIVFSIVFQVDLFSNEEPQKDSIKIYDLSEVVVTATKNPTPVLEVASSITILTKDYIENSGKVTLLELLRSVEGVEVNQSGGAGQISRVFLRGANPHHTLVLIDGIEVNDASSISNSFDLSNLLSENIEKVEVLRGPQSTLYGSEALGGVINIFTKKGGAQDQLNFSVEGGSYNTYKTSAGINGNTGKFNYYFNASRFYSDGFSAANKINGNSEDDSHLNNNINTNINYEIFKNFRLGLLADFNKSETDLDQNEILGDDPNFKSKSQDLMLKFSADLILLDSFWRQTLNISTYNRKNNIDDEVDVIRPLVYSNAFFKGSRSKIEWQNIFQIMENNSVVFGAEYEREKALSEYTGASEWGVYESIIPENEAGIYAAYLQDQFKFKNLFGSIGIRIDDHQKFGSQFTYRFAPAYILRITNTKFKGTYGTGFKSPSIYYLFDPLYGNPNLKPEKSIGWDLGFDQFISNNIVLGVTYFENNFENLIGYNQNFETVNIDKAETSGLETYFQVAPSKKLALSISYTFTKALDKSEQSEDFNKNLLRRPENKIVLNLSYINENFGSNFEIINTGKRYDKKFTGFSSERVELKSYTLVNLSASYKLTKGLKLYTRLENLLNEDYEEVLFYGSAKRSIYAGLKVQY